MTNKTNTTMANEENKAAKVEIIDPATQGNTDVNTLKEEIDKLIEENKSLAEKLKKSEYDRDIYKSLWSKADDKVSAMTDVLKEMIKLAKLN